MRQRQSILAEAFPTPKSHVWISMSDLGVDFSHEQVIFELVLADDNSDFTNPATLVPNWPAILKIGNLQFNVEVQEVPDSLDQDEGLTIFENTEIVVTRRATGIKVTHKQDAQCSIHISGQQSVLQSAECFAEREHRRAPDERQRPTARPVRSRQATLVFTAADRSNAFRSLF